MGSTKQIIETLANGAVSMLVMNNDTSIKTLGH